MKVLIFATNYLPNVGGAEIAVKEITDRLSDVEFDMVVPRLSRSVPKHERIGNVNIYRVGWGFALDKFFVDLMFLRAWRLHREESYDCLWSLMASQASVAAGVFKMFNRKIPLVLTLQEGDEEEHLKRYALGSETLYKIFIKPWHLLVFKHADRVAAISNYLIERAEQNGVPRERIVLVPNGVDVTKFKSEKPKGKSEELRADLGIKENEKVIITTSRLVKKNAVGDLIEAVEHTPKHTKLLIVGDGPESKALKSKVESRKLKERVIVFGDIPHEEIPEYLAISDVFARPSLSEGMGNSFIEAMAAGVPVVGTQVGGIPDFLIHEKTGLFCEVNNPKSIAEQIERLLEDDALREKIIQNAHEMVEERYTWERIAQVMKGEIFDKVTTS